MLSWLARAGRGDIRGSRMPNSIPAQSGIEVAAYPLAWRFVAAALIAISRTSLPIILILVVSGADISPPLLVRLVLAFALLPGVAAVLVRRAFAAVVAVQDGALVIHRRGQRIALPSVEVERAVPWRVPLPGPGVSLRTASGPRTRYELQTAVPVALLAVLGGTGATATHPTLSYAQAMYAIAPTRWYHVAWKYGLFGLLPTLVIFRLQQYIMYGGPFAQYYLYGLRAYLSTFAFYWIMVVLHLLLFASLWRLLAEAISWLAAWIAPAAAAPTRRWAERAAQILYYGGVPLLLAWRFLA